jgi:hypothetical protein
MTKKQIHRKYQKTYYKRIKFLSPHLPPSLSLVDMLQAIGGGFYWWRFRYLSGSIDPPLCPALF